MTKKTPFALVYLKEACFHSWKPICTFFGVFLAIWSIIGNLLKGALIWYTLGVFTILIVLYATYKISSWLIKLKRGRMTVSMFGKREVTLIRNGFPENMNVLLQELPKNELKSFAFIMGIDRSGNLSISTEKGVVYSVLHFLDENYQCENELPSKIAQKQLNTYLDAHKNWIDSTNKLTYGTCVEIHLMLNAIGQDGNNSIPCNLIFVANSRKESPEEKDLSEKVCDDNKSHIIIPKVFNYLLDTNKYTGAMIGVMGTNGMRQKYQVIFSQIINHYARIYYMDNHCYLNHLYISIREQDYYQRHGMPLSQLAEYVRHSAMFYTTFSE